MIYINIFNGKQMIIYCWQIVEIKLFCLYKQKKITHIYIPLYNVCKYDLYKHF